MPGAFGALTRRPCRSMKSLADGLSMRTLLMPVPLVVTSISALMSFGSFQPTLSVAITQSPYFVPGSQVKVASRPVNGCRSSNFAKSTCQSSLTLTALGEFSCIYTLNIPNLVRKEERGKRKVL